MRGLLFDIKRDCSEDGPGIRTTLFFKGCPLRCAWCHNPEGIGLYPAVMLRRGGCAPAECATPCLAACGPRALARAGDGVTLSPECCDGCGRCVAACPRAVPEAVGRWYTVDELLPRLLVDRPFFAATGGGVTLSGGEPTVQMGFAAALLRALKREGIHTAIETCGAFNHARFARQLLPWLDRIHFDLKLMDEEEHRHWTGATNRTILANLARLHRSAGERLRVRVPLVPDVTATERNLLAIRRHLEALGIEAVELLPYNPLWVDKGIAAAGPPLKRHGFMSRAAQRRAARLFSDQI